MSMRFLTPVFLLVLLTTVLCSLVPGLQQTVGSDGKTYDPMRLIRLDAFPVIESDTPHASTPDHGFPRGRLCCRCQ